MFGVYFTVWFVVLFIFGIKWLMKYASEQHKKEKRREEKLRGLDRHDIEMQDPIARFERAGENLLLHAMDSDKDWMSQQRREEGRRFRAIYGYDQEDDMVKRMGQLGDNARYLKQKHLNDCDADQVKSEASGKLSREQTEAIKKNIRARLSEGR